ncbi:MAG: hypothetical protein M1831_006487 [Alyxoria varia]|nr:MAG: hypothetical protein M1831_006487 [Alyxoria varia]
MASMAIVESQKAIAQAESFSKLTTVAFFFIPLTLCASIFGMNFKEWENEIHTWLWVVVSLLVTMFTYLALYSKDNKMALFDDRVYMQTVVRNSTAKRIRRLIIPLLFLKIFASTALSDPTFMKSSMLTVVPGLAVGIWAIVTKSPLPYASRATVASGFAVGLVYVFYPWCILVGSGMAMATWRVLTGMALLLAAVGISIWAVLAHTPLRPEERIDIAVGIGVAVPFFASWIYFLQFAKRSRTLYLALANVIAMAAMAPALWTFITKSDYDQGFKVSFSVGLGAGIPCFITFVYAFYRIAVFATEQE